MRATLIDWITTINLLLVFVGFKNASISSISLFMNKLLELTSFGWIRIWAQELGFSNSIKNWTSLLSIVSYLQVSIISFFQKQKRDNLRCWMKMDVISLLKQLELKYHCKCTSLPICSMDHIIAFRKDVIIQLFFSDYRYYHLRACQLQISCFVCVTCFGN